MFNKNLFAKLFTVAIVIFAIASFIPVRTTEPSKAGIENPKVEKLKLTAGDLILLGDSSENTFAPSFYFFAFQLWLIYCLKGYAYRCCGCCSNHNFY